MVRLIEQEVAVVWKGGKRRYFTKKAACRAAAKAVINGHLAASGESPEEVDTVEYMANVAALAKLIGDGAAWTFDFDATPWAQAVEAS